MGQICQQPKKTLINKSEEYFQISEFATLNNDINLPKELVNLFIRLKGVDENYKYSIQVQLSQIDHQISDPRHKFSSFKLIGTTTEKVPENKEIIFDNSFVVPYFFEKEQLLKLQVTQRDDFNSQNVNVETYIGKLMGTRNKNISLSLNTLTMNGELIIQACVIQNNDFSAKISFSAIFENTHVQPYFYIKRMISSDNNFQRLNSPLVNKENEWVKIFKSQVIVVKQTIYQFVEYSFEVKLLCANMSQPILVEFYDYANYNKYLGHAFFNIESFKTSSHLTLNLLDEKEKLLNSKITINCTLKQSYKFLDYLQGGLQINLIIGIDFTSSNEDPNNQNSLHFIYGDKPNAYERAIKACGQIVAYYDSDQLFPVYGYGAMLPGTQKVNHCFPINFQADPNIYTIDGVIKTYKDAIRTVRLFAPTFFAPIIRKCIEHTLYHKNEHIYIILLILTDGIINDMPATIDALVDASLLPISVIIIGIGNADFSNMDILDADENPLFNSNGVKAARDLVQFVPFNKYENNDKLLAEQVLEEIPRQIEEYFQMNNISPGGDKKMN